MKNNLLIVLVLISASFHAQFKYQGVGIFGAFTHSAHNYDNEDTEKSGIDTNYRAIYPPSHISKEFLSWGAGIFLEMGGSRTRWQTELEYVNKGANEMELVNGYTGDRSGTYSANRYKYIQWNNYLKLYYPLGAAHWYLMPGVRLEYLFSSAPTVFVPVSGNFPKFWFSGNVGVGYEFYLFRNFSVFTEYHWNPDIITHQHDNTKVRNRTMEFRVGLVMRPKKRSIDDCNAPVYRGPAY